jgi:hypothetical protein
MFWVSTDDFLWSFSTRTNDYQLLKGGANSRFYAASLNGQYIGGVTFMDGNVEVFRQLPNQKFSEPLVTVLPFPAHDLCFGNIDTVFYAATRGGLFEIHIGQKELSFRQVSQSPPVSDVAYDAQIF